MKLLHETSPHGDILESARNQNTGIKFPAWDAKYGTSHTSSLELQEKRCDKKLAEKEKTRWKSSEAFLLHWRIMEYGRMPRAKTAPWQHKIYSNMSVSDFTLRNDAIGDLRSEPNVASERIFLMDTHELVSSGISSH